MAAHTSMLHIRVDDDTKVKAAAALDAMGLSMSDAVRLLLRRIVADQAFPLELKVPNASSRAAIAEVDEIIRGRGSRFDKAENLFADLEKNSGK